ncbi:hypothetical protein [Oceanobacillus sp. CF4.6]|uniref:hypothetical protein n=1 Tax=Oceanobacillus sp. CF4.6 TaxID=3373080 RepID=UPI003EE78FBA
MSKNWMVYDSDSGDMIFHDTKEGAQKDYNEAIAGIEDAESNGEYKVYMFELRKETTIRITDEQCETTQE